MAKSTQNIALFNTPLESGLRTACVLISAYPEGCDLQRLVQYDYLIVHSGDVEDGPPSIHPATPHRSGELLVRRSLVERGIDFMVAKRVIEKSFANSGIVYTAGEYAAVFLDALASEYIAKLRSRSHWVVTRFQQMSEIALTDFMQSKWSLWGSEFVRESLFEVEHE